MTRNTHCPAAITPARQEAGFLYLPERVCWLSCLHTCLSLCSSLTHLARERCIFICTLDSLVFLSVAVSFSVYLDITVPFTCLYYTLPLWLSLSRLARELYKFFCTLDSIVSLAVVVSFCLPGYNCFSYLPVCTTLCFYVSHYFACISLSLFFSRSSYFLFVFVTFVLFVCIYLC